MSTGTGPGPDHSDYSHQPGYPAAAYQPGEHASTNTAGRVALAAGIAVVVAGLVQQGITFALPYLLDHSDLSIATLYRNFGFIGAAVTMTIALIALIAGGMGLTGSGKPKAAAAAGFALGAAALLSALLGLVGPALVYSLI